MFNLVKNWKSLRASMKEWADREYEKEIFAHVTPPPEPSDKPMKTEIVALPASLLGIDEWNGNTTARFLTNEGGSSRTVVELNPK